MTFLELQNLVAYWLDDLNFGYFTPTQVKRWLNNAQLETQKLLLAAGEQWYTVCKYTTLVPSQSAYSLPADFLKVQRLELEIDSGINTTQKLYPISMNQQDQYPGVNSRPSAYYLTKTNIKLVPPPDTALVMRLWYSYKVADMVQDTESPDVPSQYHEFLAVLAALDGLLKDGRDPSAMIEKKTYYETMLKRDADERTVDNPRHILETGQDDLIGFF